MTTFKKHYFIGFFGLFHFFIFLFLFLFLQHNKKRKKKQKLQFSFRKPSFLTFPKLCKNTILAQCDTFCVYKHTPKHHNIGETTVKKNLDQFLTFKPPNLGPILTLQQIYIYVYIYICCRVSFSTFFCLFKS